MKKDIGIAILLLVLCVIVSIMNPRFLSPYNLQNTSRQIGMFGIFGIGVGIVIITGGIDLSIGSVFALQGVLLAVMLRVRHPQPEMMEPLGLPRLIIGVVTLFVFVLCFLPFQITIT